MTGGGHPVQAGDADVEELAPVDPAVVEEEVARLEIKDHAPRYRDDCEHFAGSLAWA
jgi:hypothetical protein